MANTKYEIVAASIFSSGIISYFVPRLAHGETRRRVATHFAAGRPAPLASAFGCRWLRRGNSGRGRPPVRRLLGLFLTDGAAKGWRRIRGSGAINPFESVFRSEDWPLYSGAATDGPGAAGSELTGQRQYDRMWRARLLTDHYPVWLELSTVPATSRRQKATARCRP